MEEEKNKNQSIVDFDDLLFVWGVFVKNWYLVVALSLFGWGIGYLYLHPAFYQQPHTDTAVLSSGFAISSFKGD